MKMPVWMKFLKLHQKNTLSLIITMKSFRKIFIAALAVLFGSWVNMQAQDALSMEGNTISKTVRHKSSKSLKQKRVEDISIGIVFLT